jgi:hypothetical protein
VTYPASTTPFDRLLDGWLARAFAENGSIGFAVLLRWLPGFYPTDVVGSLLRIAESQAGTPEGVWASEVALEARQNIASLSVHDLIWQRPTPHPLDYDWRFTPESAALVAKLALDAVGPNRTIALLGTPSVQLILKEEIGSHPIILLERHSMGGNDSTNRWTGDITVDQLPELQSAVVVLDPPWYPEHIRSFLWAAAYVAAEGARVICGIPDIGTRPGIEAEWDEIVRWSKTVGLTFEVLHPGATEYLTPPFEANALRAAGIAHIPSRWRRGSIAEFRRVGRLEIGRPPQPHETGLWMEQIVGPVRWRLLLTEIKTPLVMPGISSILPGDILPSVSRRHPARLLARLWTSGNRVFHCDNPHMLRKLLRMLQYVDDESVDIAKLVRRALPDGLGAETIDCAEKTLQAAIRIQQIETNEYGGPM